MRILTLILFYTILLASCKKEQVERIRIEEEFVKYWIDFQSAAIERGFDLEIDKLSFSLSFSNFDDSTAGMCSSIPGGDILIDKAVWDTLDVETRERLIFHEFGHCLLGRRHPSEEVLDEFERNLRCFECSSLMTAILPGFQCGIDYSSKIWKEFYLDELFGILDAPVWVNSNIENPKVDSSEIKYVICDKKSSSPGFPEDLNYLQNYIITVDIVGFVDFKMIRENLIFNFDSDFGDCTINEDDKVIVDLSYINNWRTFNDDYGNTNFSYLHLDGFEYYFIKDKLLHSREVESNNRFSKFEFENDVEFCLKIYNYGN